MNTRLLARYDFLIDGVDSTYEEFVQKIKEVSEHITVRDISKDPAILLDDPKIIAELTALPIDRREAVIQSTFVPYIIDMNLNNLERLLTADKTQVFALDTVTFALILRETILNLTEQEDRRLDTMVFQIDNTSVPRNYFYEKLRKELFSYEADAFIAQFELHLSQMSSANPEDISHIQKQIYRYQYADIKSKLLSHDYTHQVLHSGYIRIRVSSQGPLYTIEDTALNIQVETAIPTRPAVLVIPGNNGQMLKGTRRYS